MSDLWHWKTLGEIFSPDTDQARQSAIDVPEEKWQSLATFALSHLVAPELYHQLLKLNALEILPSDVALALEGTAELNAILQDDLRATFRRVVEVANKLGMTPIILKGGIDIVSDADAVNVSRMVSDLDILVDAEEAGPLYAALIQEGFCTEEVAPAVLNYIFSQGVSCHFPALWHPDIRQYIEVHTALGLSPAEIALTDALREDSHLRRDSGIEFKVPSIVHRLSHNALHHFVHHNALQSGDRSFRQALDFARLAVQSPPGATVLPALEVDSQWQGLHSALRVSASFASELFKFELPHSPLSKAELRAEKRFWTFRRATFLDRVYRVRWSISNAASRGHQWRKLLDPAYVAFKARSIVRKSALFPPKK